MTKAAGSWVQWIEDWPEKPPAYLGAAGLYLGMIGLCLGGFYPVFSMDASWSDRESPAAGSWDGVAPATGQWSDEETITS